MKAVMCRSVVLVCFLACAVGPAAAQQEPGFEPVPHGTVRDGVLTIAEENFSVKAPGKEWEWLRGVKPLGTIGKNYLCRNRKTDARFVLTVFEPGGGSDEKKLMEGILSGIRKSQEASGRRVEDARYGPAPIPAPGSYRLSAKISSAEAAGYFTGYALAAGRLYVFQLYSHEPNEPATFTTAVRSFQLLAPVAAAPKGAEAGSAVAVTLYVLVLVVFFPLGALVNALARKPVVDGGLIAAVLILIMAVLRLAGAVVANPIGSAEAVGYTIGEALVPAAIAVWVHYRYVNKKRALRDSAPPAGAAAR